jgi:hypothetical protein
MKEATDENNEDTADRVKSSTELDAELCAQLRGPSDDLQLAGSNVVVCGGLFTVAMPSCWYMHQYMHQKDVARNLPMPEPTPSS